MQNTIRTTIRLRKDLLDQSRFIALKRSSTLQDTINQTLALGLGHISDIAIREKEIAKIDKFRESLGHKQVNVKQLLEASRKDLK